LSINSDNYKDTLKVKIDNYYIEYLNEDSRLVSEFLINLKFKENIFPLHFKKEYSRKVLFRFKELK
jgi:hypothetical protein